MTVLTDTGDVLDQESCEKLFYLLATTTDLQASPPMALQANAQRQLEATLSRALELNDQFFQQERDKLEAWAEDRIASAELALKDTKLKLKGLKRQARLELSMEDAQRLQQDIRKTETEQRRQRQAASHFCCGRRNRSPARYAHCCPAKAPAPRQPQPKPVCAALERGLMFLKFKISDA